MRTLTFWWANEALALGGEQRSRPCAAVMSELADTTHVMRGAPICTISNSSILAPSSHARKGNTILNNARQGRALHADKSISPHTG